MRRRREFALFAAALIAARLHLAAAQAVILPVGNTSLALDDVSIGGTTYAAPAGGCNVTVRLAGASGGGLSRTFILGPPYFWTGGRGASFQVSFFLGDGQELSAWLGGAGFCDPDPAAGTLGGGGGSSALTLQDGTVLAVAGAGAGGAGSSSGGSAGMPGGAGGQGANGNAMGGRGGTQSAPGAAGVSSGLPGAGREAGAGTGSNGGDGAVGDANAGTTGGGLGFSSSNGGMCGAEVALEAAAAGSAEVAADTALPMVPEAEEEAAG